ncbi:sugar phosphate isomerase/epimerase family protein [Fodinibius saliphilus]|uniref:sugar phosphate isomerase/epimerase family protein n=1 Tax=Fodinibius saliphilus TaxID=1920650 RepID=UPI001BB2B172|nr:sugar phosphate isomerase/epimerase family protein [Fodinibius saliphilus]
MNRKSFLKVAGLIAVSVSVPGLAKAASLYSNSSSESFFDISLAEWSLHRHIFDDKIDHLEFPAIAKNEFGINAVEYVNQFFADKVNDKSYLDEMNSRCEDLGVEQLLIMVDGEGDLAVTDKQKRKASVENHYKWVEAAEYLGCHSIRVNTYGDGTPQEQKRAAVDGLGRLAEFASDYDINIIVENHGGYSSHGQWLSEVMDEVEMENCGTLPDFGNFCIKKKGDSRWEGECVEEYDRYQGVKEMMPYAKGVSAKSYAFNQQGQETTIDFRKMLNIIHMAGYNGHIGIEYEGEGLSEFEGIKATKSLLLNIEKQLSTK